MTNIDTSRPIGRRYQRDLPPISAAAADAEPAEDQLYYKDKLATLPDPPTREEPNGSAPAPKTTGKIVISTTVEHRGRTFTIAAEGMTVDQLCDLLDKRGYAPPATVAPAAPLASSDDLSDGWKLCRKHNAPMRPRNKQNEHWHSHNVGTPENPCWCKGYKGADSPGYEL